MKVGLKPRRSPGGPESAIRILKLKSDKKADKNGISTRALQTLLGHDRLTITELYLNLSPEDAIREFLTE